MPNEEEQARLVQEIENPNIHKGPLLCTGCQKSIQEHCQKCLACKEEHVCRPLG